VHAELADLRIHVGRKRVARLMRALGVYGVSRRKGPRTTRRDSAHRPAPDLVARDFAVTGPDRLWVADITYIPTWAGFLYLAVVVDAWSRRVIGWAMASHLRTELVLAALDMAVEQRQPADVIHHSDQGCQYTSIAFGVRCQEAGVRPSMGSVGDAYDIGGFGRLGGGDEAEAQVLSAAPKVVKHALSVGLFIVRGAGVGVRHTKPEGVVEEDRELPSGSGDGLGLAGSRREAAVEGAEGGLSPADVHRRNSQEHGRPIGGPTGLGAEHAATRDLVARGQTEPRREVLGRGPLTHVVAAGSQKV
jgi:transposase InsO family protein